MDHPGITLERLPYDYSAWRVVVHASDGPFAAALEFYTDVEELEEFARRLTAFPRDPGDEARFELGSRDGHWAYYLLLRAFLYDRAGHAVLEFAADNRESSLRHAQASFGSSRATSRRSTAWSNSYKFGSAILPRSCSLERSPPINKHYLS
jgi:hypothetical protein